MKGFWLGLLFLLGLYVVLNMWSTPTASQALEELGPCFGKISVRGHYSPFGQTLTVVCEIEKDLVVKDG